MSKPIRNQYEPDYVSPPGETLLEVIESMGLSQADLAERTGRPKKTINEIIKGKAAITPETALQLERVLGVPAGFWNNRERNYREFLAKQEERERLEKGIGWLKKCPVKEMVKFGWIQGYRDEIHQFREVLNFFGVASPESWDELWCKSEITAFRKSPAFQSDPCAVAAWLRKGEMEAMNKDCASYSVEGFKEILKQIRALTASAPEYSLLESVRLCASVGVALVFVQELPKTRVSGAVRWLTSSKAVIQLSFRYKTDDHLWFTFFHEAGHILQHGKRDIFLEGESDLDSKEEEADRFAANFLIPDNLLQYFKDPKQRSKDCIKRFAAEIGIAPGIVVGRLQHEKILPRSHCNDLKQGIDFSGNRSLAY